MTIRGDQHVAGESFIATELYTPVTGPVLKAHESLLLLAFAAAEGCSVYKTDTSQDFLYGSMENDVVHRRAPDWWPKPIPEGHCLQLLKNIYGTAWIANGYFAVNSEKTIVMKREGKHFIIRVHGLFVDDMMHIATTNKLKNEFMQKYSRDFNITGGGLMKTFLGMEIEQSNRLIKLHLNHYIREMLNAYKAYIKKLLRPKCVPFSPGVIFRPEDSSTLLDRSKQKFYMSFVAKLQFAASWIRFDISFAVSQLARFCVSAGSTHWAALHHLMEYFEGLPSFKTTYRRRIKHNQDLLSGYADSDWGNSSS